MALAPGTIVQLKSGSPALTVIALGLDAVEVMWFAEESGEFRTFSLPAAALDEIEIEEFEDEDEVE